MTVCEKAWNGVPHAAIKAQGLTTQVHTCDLPAGHVGPCICVPGPDQVTSGP